jgi:hypothetical protein
VKTLHSLQIAQSRGIDLCSSWDGRSQVNTWYRTSYGNGGKPSRGCSGREVCRDANGKDGSCLTPCRLSRWRRMLDDAGCWRYFSPGIEGTVPSGNYFPCKYRKYVSYLVRSHFQCRPLVSPPTQALGPEVDIWSQSLLRHAAAHSRGGSCAAGATGDR